MKIYRTLEALNTAPKGMVVALGNFDGVHQGHQEIINVAQEMAQKTDQPTRICVVTFEPHPRQFFQPDNPAFRLGTAMQKAALLADIGVTDLVELCFDKQLASMPAQTFIETYLVKMLGVSQIVVGEDFKFGYQRGGDVHMLREFGKYHDFAVTGLPVICSSEGEVYSSSRVRTALAEGNLRQANAILGRMHCIEGVVCSGDQRGRSIGFPTANIPLEGLFLPRFGVYAVTATFQNASIQNASAIQDHPHYQGVANLGIRPTFDKTTPLLEVHLFDFSKDIYGKNLTVSLVEFLRPEQRFNGIEALIQQIQQDSEQAKAVLSKL